jgi:hypothetical protein
VDSLTQVYGFRHRDSIGKGDAFFVKSLLYDFENAFAANKKAGTLRMEGTLQLFCVMGVMKKKWGI